MPEKNKVLTPSTWDRFKRVLTYVEGMMKAKIPGGNNTPNGPVFPDPKVAANPRRSEDPPREWLWFIITAHTQDGANQRWQYEWFQVHKANPGFGGWDPRGVTSDDDGYTFAYNFAESDNGSGGLAGNGIDISGLTGTFEIQPAPVGWPYLGYFVPNGTNATEVWFSHENGVDGSCS